MSGFLPPGPPTHSSEEDHAHLVRRVLDGEEQRTRWAARAAQWRARELAEICFGGQAEATLAGPLPPNGPVRGLLLLDVPFDDLPSHQEAESRFLAAAARDPVLQQVPLVYVFGPANV